MKAYILKSKRRIAPFDRCADAIYSPLSNFGNLLREELSLTGLGVRFIKSIREMDLNESSLLMPDYVFVTSPIVKRFLFICQNSPDVIQRLSVLRSSLTDYYTPLMDIDVRLIDEEELLLFDIFYLPAGVRLLDGVDFSDLITDLRRSVRVAKISQNFGIRLRRMPNVRGRVFYEEFPLTDEIVGHQRFWYHSLLMNILYIGTFRERVASGKFSSGFLRGPRLVDNDRIVNSVIGSNVWLHPTSIVENSVLCDNVKVGAKTIIKDSIIMRDVSIGDHNIVNLSLFGERVNTLSNSVFCSSVIEPSSTVSNLGCYYSFLGRDTFLATAVILLWEGVDSTIKIQTESGEIDTGRYFLGAAIGGGSILGARAILSPGIMIPKNSVVVLRPEEGVMKIPTLSEREYYVWENASLSRFEDVFPYYDKNDFF